MTRVIRANPPGPGTAIARAVAVATFSLAGELVAGSSDPLPAWKAGRLFVWYASLATPGTTATSVTLAINGAPAAGITVPAGASTSPVTEIVNGPIVTPFVSELVATVTPGTGAGGLVALAILI